MSSIRKQVKKVAGKQIRCHNGQEAAGIICAISIRIMMNILPIQRILKIGSCDLYIGGAEHAVLHLLYARFWHKVLYDIGVVPTKEPFQKLFNQGMILGENNEKMSKSKGNVVNPDEIVDSHGADTLRLYEMFMGPLEASIAWSTTGLDGARRFLDRVWRLFVNDEGTLSDKIVKIKPMEHLEKVYHQTVKKVTEDYETLTFQYSDFTNDGLH